jgi:hypothetical protein
MYIMPLGASIGENVKISGGCWVNKEPNWDTTWSKGGAEIKVHIGDTLRGTHPPGITSQPLGWQGLS